MLQSKMNKESFNLLHHSLLNSLLIKRLKFTIEPNQSCTFIHT